MSISGEWNAYSNKNLNFFKEDKISNWILIKFMRSIIIFSAL